MVGFGIGVFVTCLPGLRVLTFVDEAIVDAGNCESPFYTVFSFALTRHGSVKTD